MDDRRAMPLIWMLIASLLFASMGVCVKLGSAIFSPAELVFWRGFIALLLIYGYILGTGRSLVTRHWRVHLTRSGAGLIALASYFYSITQIPLATAATLGYTAPLFLALLLVLWAGERPNRRLVLAMVVGFCGIVLLLKPTLRSDQWLGGLAGLLSGMVSSVAYFQVRQLGALGEPEWRTVFFFSLMASIGGLPWVLLGTPVHHVDLHGGLLLLGVGGFGALAQLAMTRAYKHGKTLATANFSYSTVVFASLYGVVLWQEILSWTSWLAIALIIASGIMATLSSRAPGARRADPPVAEELDL